MEGMVADPVMPVGAQREERAALATPNSRRIRAGSSLSYLQSRPRLEAGVSGWRDTRLCLERREPGYGRRGH